PPQQRIACRRNSGFRCDLRGLGNLNAIHCPSHIHRATISAPAILKRFAEATGPIASNTLWLLLAIVSLRRQNWLKRTGSSIDTVVASTHHLGIGSSSDQNANAISTAIRSVAPRNRT